MCVEDGVELPQLSVNRQADNKKNRRIGIFLKPGTPTSQQIIAWMQEEDYNKGENCGRDAGNKAFSLDEQRTVVIPSAARRSEATKRKSRDLAFRSRPHPTQAAESFYPGVNRAISHDFFSQRQFFICFSCEIALCR